MAVGRVLVRYTRSAAFSYKDLSGQNRHWASARAARQPYIGVALNRAGKTRKSRMSMIEGAEHDRCATKTS